jgi:hypothetical protein
MGNAQSRVIAAGARFLPSSTITRPDNTTSYAAGDVIADDASEPTVATIQVARVPGGSGIIHDALVVESANQTTKADLEIWLFTSEPTAMEDNAPFDPTDAELLTLVGILDLGDAPTDANPGSGADGNEVYHLTNQDMIFKCASGLQILYWIPVVRNAYTPVAQETFTLILGVEQD